MNARQKRMPWLHASTSVMTLAPVVVNPDTVSNMASVTVIGVEHHRKGSMPNSENTTHTSAVRMQPSRRRRFTVTLRVANSMTKAVSPATPTAMAKACQSLSP